MFTPCSRNLLENQCCSLRGFNNNCGESEQLGVGELMDYFFFPNVTKPHCLRYVNKHTERCGKLNGYADWTSRGSSFAEVL